MTQPFDFVLDLFEHIGGLLESAYNFLFEGFDVLGIHISGWGLLGGVGLSVLLIAVIVKSVTPLL